MTSDTSGGAVRTARPHPAARVAGLGTLLVPMMLVELFSGVLQLYFSPLYPTLVAKYHVDVATLSWALIVFTLAGAISTPVFAALGDAHGHRKVLKVEVAVVTVGTILIAAAPSFPVLLAGRFLQGTFPAFLPLMFGIVRTRHSADTTRRAVAYLSSVLLFGTAAGAVTTSFLLKLSAGPQLVTWLPAVGLVAGFAALWAGRETGFVRDRRVRIDWAGVALLGIGLAALLLGLDEGPSWGWTSARILTAVVGGAAVLAVWVAVELRVAQPLADVRFLFRPALVPVYLVGVGVYFGIVGGQVASATFMALPHHKLGFGLGLDSSHIALMFLPILGVAAATAMVTAPLGRRIGYSWVMALGAVCALVSAAGLIFFHGSVGQYLPLATLAGAGLGFVEGSTRAVVVGQLRDGEVSMGQGIYELSTVIGSALGAAVLGGILSAHTLLPRVPAEHAFVLVWTTMAGLAAVATVAALVHAARSDGNRA